jgi:hypothetical protein
MTDSSAATWPQHVRIKEVPFGTHGRHPGVF